jgi:hypothetical protein
MGFKKVGEFRLTRTTPRVVFIKIGEQICVNLCSSCWRLIVLLHLLKG